MITYALMPKRQSVVQFSAPADLMGDRQSQNELLMSYRLSYRLSPMWLLLLLG